MFPQFVRHNGLTIDERTLLFKWPTSLIIKRSSVIPIYNPFQNKNRPTIERSPNLTMFINIS